MKRRIAVLGTQVPFIRGGAEVLNDELVRQINLRGDRYNVVADLIQLPFKWYPDEHVLQDMLAWKLVDVTVSDGTPIDMVIGTKFPSYVADHPKKILWLVHQHRAFYDLEGTAFDTAHLSKFDRSVRHAVRRADTIALESCKARYSIADTVTKRLIRYNNLGAQVLYPPPKLRDEIHPGRYGDYILYVGRTERIKRIEYLIDALASRKQARAVIIGTGKFLPELQKRAADLDLGDRCVFAGYVSDAEYIRYLADCRAVYYGPYDEDYGFATVEAFLAEKPVLTFRDSGEPAHIVERVACGHIAEETSARGLAEIVGRVLDAPDTALKDMGVRGRSFASGIHWDSVFTQLVEAHL